MRTTAFFFVKFAFYKIPLLIEKTMSGAVYLSSPNIEQIFETDKEAKRLAKKILTTI